jgi:hypothetical protein
MLLKSEQPTTATTLQNFCRSFDFLLKSHAQNGAPNDKHDANVAVEGQWVVCKICVKILDGDIGLGLRQKGTFVAKSTISAVLAESALPPPFRKFGGGL